MRRAYALLEQVLLKHPDDGLVVLAAQRDARGEVVDFRHEWVSRAMERHSGAELMGRGMVQLFPQTSARLVPWLREVLREADDWRRVEGYMSLRRDGDASRWYVLESCRIDDDHIVVRVRDITERHELEQALERQAMQDPLTGLPNRRMLDTHLEAALARLARHPAPLALLFCDVDNFKWINDHLGHLTGDEVLRQVAARLRAAVRPEDVVARFGGDEFVVLATELSQPEDSAVIAERVLEEVGGMYRAAGADLFANVSIGISVTSAPHDPERLLGEADSALHQAKRRGRGRYELFDSTLAQQISRRLQVETGLHEALRNGEFFLLYQPLVDLVTGRTASVEALLRWRHPVRGVLPPGEFLDIAEDSGIIVDIGTWVVRQACADARIWAGLSPEPPVVQVNLAARQLVDSRLLDDVRRALADHDVDPRLFGVEVTESQLMIDLDSSRANLQALRDMGVTIALDDFGTGYSSLQWLQRLPVHEVKLDRSFITPIARGVVEQEVVHALVGLVHVLGLKVVGEGVEDEVQRQLLGELGCDYGQGYHLGMPVPAHEIARLLSAGSPPRRIELPEPQQVDGPV